MTSREIIRHVEQHGFWLLRNGTRHLIYTDGQIRLTLRRSGQTSPRMRNDILVKVKHSVERRQAVA